MNLFNKLVMILLLLLSVIGSVGLIFTALLFPGEALANARNAIAFLDENTSLGIQIAVAAAAAIFAFVCFLLLVAEVLPKGARGVKLTGVKGASAELTLEAIISRIRYEAEQVPQVRYVRPVVKSRGKEVDVDVDLRTDPTVEVAAKTEEVSQVVRDAVENKMGIKLRHLRIFVYHEPLPKEAKGKGNSRQTTSSEPSSGPLR